MDILMPYLYPAKESRMKHFTILVPNGQNNLSSIVGAYKILSRANEQWRKAGKEDVFRIQLAGQSEKVDFHDGLFFVQPHVYVSDIRHTDFVLIPSLNHNFVESVRENAELIDWIRDQYNNGAEVASICTGAFLLASTGVLEGRSCSTHWSVTSVFRELFPGVNLVADKLITDENRIYTNGGAFSFLHLMLYLVEKYYDRQTAIYCSKVFQIDIERNSQSAFSIFTGQKEHNDEVILKAQELLERKIDEKYSIEELAADLTISRRNFDRRFIRATGNTPMEYLQRVKIEAAKKAFENTRKTVSEVMYDVGYSDTKAFRELFKRITGLSPLDYRNRYNKDADVR